MAFSSLIFLFLFLPLTLIGYYCTPLRWRNGFLLAASAVFYLWGAPRFFFILLAAAVFDYWMSCLIHRTQDERKRKRFLIFGLTMNLTLLGYFKYANFFAAEMNHLLNSLGVSPLPWTAVILPIGISFITFEEISYLVDIYRRVTRPAPNFPTYALFLCLFPHLIAGPIFRYHDVSEQLVARTHSRTLFVEGLLRFCAGLGKKVLIADAVAQIADPIFSANPATLSAGFAWLGVLSYAVQIYFDFSGYSDMAIGLGRMFGFRFVENFNQPYTATSITDFWKRWHISLSNWMKEYLYVPLGGNRRGPWRTYLNLWIVFLLSGFWHGADWTFLCWGLYHGCFLVIERSFLLKVLARLPVLLQRIWTFLVVCFGWVLFRSETISQAAGFWAALFRIAPAKTDFLLADIASARGLLMLVLGLLLGLTLQKPVISLVHIQRPSRLAFAGCSALLLLFVATLSLVNSEFHPFIYFRF